MADKFTPDQIEKLRKLGYLGSFTGNGSDSEMVQDLDDDVKSENLDEVAGDAKALQDLKTSEAPNQVLSAIEPTGGPFSILKHLNTTNKSYDYSPLLMAARMYDTNQGSEYPNGVNGFGDPSTFAKDTDISTKPIKKSDRSIASKASSKPVTATPEKSALADIDAGTGTINTRDNMAEAMKLAGNLTMMNEMGKAGDKILAGLTRTNPQFQDQYNEGIQQAQAMPGKFQEIAGQESNDPNSPQSKAFKEYIKRFGINLKGDVSAATAQSLLPAIYKQYEGEQNRQTKQAIIAQTLAEKSQASQQNLFNKILLANLVNASKEKIANENNETKKAGFQNQRDKFDTTQAAAAQKGLNTDKNYVKYSGQVEEANQAKNLVDDAVQNGGESAKAIGVYMARYATGGQRLSVPEINALGGSVGNIKQKVANAYSNLVSGKITPEQGQFLKNFINVTANAAGQAKKNIELDRAHKYQQIRKGTSEEDAYKAITGNDLQSQASPNTKQYTPGQVITLKDGRKFRVKSDGDSLEPM